MTEHKQVVKTFALLLVFFTTVIGVFFYTVRKNIPHAPKENSAHIKEEIHKPVMWNELTNLTDESTVTIVIGGVSISAEVARSDGKKALGLSGHDPLQEGEGMMFIFDRASSLSFWNKDMRFPIDILWLHNDTVIGVSESLPLFIEGDIPTIVTSPPEVQVALEVPDGFVKKYNITNNSNIIIYENK